MYKHFFKRVIDFVISLLGLLILSPFLILIWIILLFINRGHPFFLQTRPGKGQKAFKIIKFKSMTDKRDSKGNLLPDNQRITKFGNWVRRFSIDELPQLINVLRGDMSLIGPRPLLFKYIPLYTKEQLRRHEVKPGITGWAQVNGRNAISWTEKFEFDIAYIDYLSFKMDIKILYLTILKVLKQKDINEGANNTMSAFKGK